MPLRTRGKGVLRVMWGVIGELLMDNVSFEENQDVPGL
jgi:hypothetical protein